MEKTKKNYEAYLNDLYHGGGMSEAELEQYSYLGRGQNLVKQGKLGTALRRHDPIAFECGFNDWRPNS